MHVHDGVRVGVLQRAADVLAQLDAGHRKALVAALGFDLEALGAQHIVFEIADRKFGDRVLVLGAGRGTHQLDDAENLARRLKGRVDIGVVLLCLDIDRGLQAIDLEAADRLEPTAQIGQELCLEGLAVQALEDDLAQLAENDIVQIRLLLYLSLVTIQSVLIRESSEGERL